MAALRSRRSERRSSRVWWRCGRAERYAAGWKSGGRKSERGRAVGKGRGASSSSSSSEPDPWSEEVAEGADDVLADEGRLKMAVAERDVGVGAARLAILLSGSVIELRYSLRLRRKRKLGCKGVVQPLEASVSFHGH